MLLRNENEQEVISREKKDRRDFGHLSALATRMGLHCCQFDKVVVFSKVPLPNYRPDLDSKRPQREVVLPHGLQDRVNALLKAYCSKKSINNTSSEYDHLHISVRNSPVPYSPLTDAELDLSHGGVFPICRAVFQHGMVLAQGNVIASTRISNELGAGNTETTKMATWAVMVLGFAEMLVANIAVLACGNILGYAFSAEEEVVNYITKMSPLISVMYLSGTQGVLSDICCIVKKYVKKEQDIDTNMVITEEDDNCNNDDHDALYHEKKRYNNHDSSNSRRYIQPENAYFVTKMRRKRRHNLYIPKEVIMDYNLRLPPSVTLRDMGGREWTSHVRVWRDGRTWLSGGWRDLCDTNLVGNKDRCICEFLPHQMGNNVVLQVTIVTEQDANQINEE
nr:B3 domain-containing protein At5g60130-like [Ipomoea trifida]